jgi:hypothetical protein
MASAAHALGYTPYWMDLNSFPATTCTKVIGAQNDLYSLGSRLSQKIGLFNKLVWEPINSEGFRKLTYNAADQKNAELMAPLLRHLPKDVPYVATHAWPAQAAIHAGFTRVVNAIPDNWPMALHLSEGSIHTVQTPSAFLGYKMLRGMDPKRQLKPMPKGSLFDVGHYIDHELVENTEADCQARLDRMAAGKPRRYLLSIGGAGAQQKLFEDIIRHLLPQIRAGKVTLLVNTGDHFEVFNSIVSHIPELGRLDMTGIVPDSDAIPEEQALSAGRKAIAEMLGIPENELPETRAYYTVKGSIVRSPSSVPPGQPVWTVICAENKACAVLSPDGKQLLYAGQ